MLVPYLVFLAVFCLSNTVFAEEDANVSVKVQFPCKLHRIVHTIRVKRCVSKRVLSYACQGSCPSYTRVNLKKPSLMERGCKCCQETGEISRSVRMACLTGDSSWGFKRVPMGLKLPTACMCRPCSEALYAEAQEFADYDNKRTLWSLRG